MSDTLRSGAYVRTIDIIGEGPTGGLVNGARSIYLDGTPLQNADGSFNFKGVTWVERTGTATQDYVPGFESVEAATAVGVQISENTPVTRTISEDTADSMTIVIGVPAIQHIDAESGESESTTVNLIVEVQPSGGNWQPAHIGKSSFSLTTSRGSTTGTTSANLTTGGKTTGVQAQVQVKYQCDTALTQIYPTTEQWVTYRLNYRKVGTSTWTTAKENTIVAKLDKVVEVNQGEDSINRNYYLASETTKITLEKGFAYEFQLVKVEENAAGLATTFSMNGTALEATNQITIKGVSTSRYQRQATILLPAGGSPWNVRVTRLTEDSSDSRTQNDTYWDSYTVRTYAKMGYPFCAYVAMTFDSEQFSSIPTRGFECWGRLIKVPTNYNPVKRTYTGSWDGGTFKDAWSDNPAWVFYDILTHPRYGLGKYISASAVYKWDLYAIAQYCDEMVPTGFGGVEPRFTCNLYLASREEAYKVLQDIASIFRGMIYWASGMIYASQDSPASAKAIYSPANVIDGLFTYSGTALKTRHSVVLVKWNDPEDLYRQKTELVEDREAIALYGFAQTEMMAIGCTSRGQAIRAGRWMLYSERAQGETVSFKTGLDTMPRRPGEIIKIADPARAGVRYGGRLKAVGTSSVTIDAPVDLLAGQTYTLTTLKADGSLQDHTVTTAAGTGKTTLALTPAFTVQPAVGSMWMLVSTEVRAQQFRVLTLTESAPNIIDVTAVAHDPNKYAWVEEGVKIKPRSISVISSKPPAPASVSVSEVLYRKGQQLLTRLIVSWPPVEGVTQYQVRWRRNGGAEQIEGVSEVTSEITSAVDGQVYEISVYSINAIGMKSADGRTISHTVLGKLAPPSNVDGFSAARSGDTLSFSWRAIADADASRYEIRRGQTWDTGVKVASITHPTNSAQILSPRGGRYMIRAIDTSGIYSNASDVVSIGEMSGINVFLTFDDGAQEFPGTLGANLEYQIITSTKWEDLPTWGELKTWAAPLYEKYPITKLGVSSGNYTTEVIDIGYYATSLLHLDPWVDSPDPQPTGGVVGATYDVRTSSDGVSWSAWANFTPGSYGFRYLQLRATLTCNEKAVAGSYRARLRDLKLTIDVPDRILKFGTKSVPSGGLNLSFSPKFVGVDTVQVTLQSPDVGDTYVLSGKSSSGISLQIFSAAGTAKAGTADITVFGYGERN